MLLNELQKEHAKIQVQDETIRKLEARIAALEAQSSNTTARLTPANPSPSADGR
jgi:hypothetical protein